MKILVIAYACEPNRGSEPEVGWQWVQQLCREHDVCVFTKANNKEPIEATDIRLKFPNLRFEYIHVPMWLSFWKKKNFGIQLYYVLWQLFALYRGMILHRKEKFDLAHHLTFSPFYFPPIVSLLPIPFIWGPVGAGEIVPRQYFSLFTVRQQLREYLRLLVRIIAKYNPLFLYASRKALLIVAATQETKNVFPLTCAKKILVEPQIGMDLSSSLKMKEKASTTECIRILTAGRHVYWKGHIIVIKAFARLLTKTNKRFELVVLSNGPELARLEREVHVQGINDKVSFLNWLPDRSAVFEQYARANVFAYCSFFECGGYVVLEAMAHGVPVISIHLGGPGEIVTNENGALVEPGPIEETIETFSNLLLELAFNDKWLPRKIERTIKDINELHRWDMKGDRLLKMIREKIK